MLTEKKIEQFYKDFDSMELLKPNATMQKATGLSSGNVSDYLNRKKKPSESFINAFYEKVYKPSTIAPYHENRRNLKQNKTSDEIMYYEIGATAGQHGAEILPVNKNEGKLRISDLFKGSQFAIRISGNSMLPNYPPGAIIGIREVQDKQITPGSVYVVEKDSDLWIKRLFYAGDQQESGKFECVSDNTMKHESGHRQGKYCYPAFHIDIDSVRRLFKVVGVYKANELTVITQ
ncbi:MAG: S24 family peptidase [Ferruginibacter sp.]